MAGRKLRRPDRHIATVDHNVPTTSAQDRLLIADQISADTRSTRCARTAPSSASSSSTCRTLDQGIVHMIGPELGATKPGMTIVCGDSHTSTHGAFGALAFGIGTSEVEHVMATQTLPQSKPKTFRITVDGDLPFGVTAKDIILDIIGRIGTDGATGYVIEYAGSAIRALSMEGRMTICNMSIEAGARAGMIAPDETTFAYLKGRRFSPTGAAWDEAVAHWRTLPTDPGATFDRELHIDAATLAPTVTWGTSPGMVTTIDGTVPSLDDAPTEADKSPSSAPSSTWASSPARRSKTSRSTPSSSAPAPTAASKTSAPPPPSSTATTSPPQSAPWSSPARRRSSARPKQKASTPSSRPPASSGASPAAACASA